MDYSEAQVSETQPNRGREIGVALLILVGAVTLFLAPPDWLGAGTGFGNTRASRPIRTPYERAGRSRRLCRCGSSDHGASGSVVSTCRSDQRVS